MESKTSVHGSLGDFEVDGKKIWLTRLDSEEKGWLCEEGGGCQALCLTAGENQLSKLCD